MGALGSHFFLNEFTNEEVEIYEHCTCLDGAELANIYEKFRMMGGKRVRKGEQEQRIGKRIGHKTAKNLCAPRISTDATGTGILQQARVAHLRTSCTCTPSQHARRPWMYTRPRSPIAISSVFSSPHQFSHRGTHAKLLVVSD